MSYTINLGQWNMIFAVPSALVDRHLKLASAAQIKVLLYILRHAGEDFLAGDIAAAAGISADEVKNAVDFWVERGLLHDSGDVLAPSETVLDAVSHVSDSTVQRQAEAATKPHTVVSRARRPDPMFVSQLLQSDINLAGLLEEAQTVLKKPLSPGDTATLVMLYDTFGLPCEVIAMLIHYLSSQGGANMRAIEKLGLRWADEGVYTVSAAEEAIERMTASREAWVRVSALFGIHNVGNPTKTQLEYADRWINTWRFSDDMLLEAYERCVNTKGEYNIRYINGILQRWQERHIYSLDALREAEAAVKKQNKKPSGNKKGSVFSVDGASFDVSQYEKQSLFDD